jgi:hypothetical protein
MFSRKMMFKRDEQMEVAWSKVGAIRRMLEDFPLEISQRLRASPYCQQDKWDAILSLFTLEKCAVFWNEHTLYKPWDK